MGSDLEEQDKTPNQSSNEAKKTCVDCGTSKTPLWRGGPAGPKSLCNACGIRSRKKRREVLGVNRGEEKKRKRSIGTSSSSSSNIGGSSSSKIGDKLKQRLWREVMMRRSTLKKQRRKLGEEEQAAVLLMALSCGSVYA